MKLVSETGRVIVEEGDPVVIGGRNVATVAKIESLHDGEYGISFSFSDDFYKNIIGDMWCIELDDAKVVI